MPWMHMLARNCSAAMFFLAILFLSGIVTVDALGSANPNYMTHAVKIDIFGNGSDAFRELFGVEMTPPVVVKYMDYVVEVYYYHPENSRQRHT